MTLRKWKSMTPGAWACNLALYGIGVGIMPMGVVLTINAHLGAGGYDALSGSGSIHPLAFMPQPFWW